MTTFWTAADQAELDVLIWALVDGWDKHRHTCRLRPCPHLHDAIREVVDWRQARILLSNAQAFRLDEELRRAS